MAKLLILLGALLLVLGAVANRQGADSALRFYPALILPLNRSLVAGPDIPPHLTAQGIAVAYFLPGIALLVVGSALSRRSRRLKQHSTQPSQP